MGKVYFAVVITISIILGIIAISANQQQKSSFQPIVVDALSQVPNQISIIPSTPQATPSQQPTPAPHLLFPQSEWVTNATSAAIITAKGQIAIQLYNQDAPKTVTNFATLAKKGYYNNLTFHRVEPGFVIQGGDPSGDGTGGYSIYGPTFEDELNPQTASYQAGYKEGVVAMANRGPNTNGSQFFIMLADNTSLPKNYTIFGKVISGMDVVKQIVIGDKMQQINVQ